MRKTSNSYFPLSCTVVSNEKNFHIENFTTRNSVEIVVIRCWCSRALIFWWRENNVKLKLSRVSNRILSSALKLYIRWLSHRRKSQSNSWSESFNVGTRRCSRLWDVHHLTLFPPLSPAYHPLEQEPMYTRKYTFIKVTIVSLSKLSRGFLCVFSSIHSLFVVAFDRLSSPLRALSVVLLFFASRARLPHQLWRFIQRYFPIEQPQSLDIIKQVNKRENHRIYLEQKRVSLSRGAFDTETRCDDSAR